MNAWRSNVMYTGKDTGLEEFNRLVLQHQDEAFCLAYYMLGSEASAGQIVQLAVKQAYTNFRSTSSDFRTQILQLISAGCLKSHNRSPNITAQTGTLQMQLGGLPGRERLAIILIDLLGLSYSQTGDVLRQPPARVRELLTQGRLKLRKKIPPAK